MPKPRFSRIRYAVRTVQARPVPLLAFAFGAALPLAFVAVSWAHKTGGLAGPIPDPRPPAFVVATD